MEGSGLGEHPKKIGTPYLFLKPLKLATSHLVHDLGLGSSLLRNNIYDQNWQGSGLGSTQKIGILLIFAIVEASNFKFGIQRGFGEQRIKKQLLRPKLAEVLAREHPKNGTLYLFLQLLNKFGTHLGFGEYVTITTLVPNLVGDG